MGIISRPVQVHHWLERMFSFRISASVYKRYLLEIGKLKELKYNILFCLKFSLLTNSEFHPAPVIASNPCRNPLTEHPQFPPLSQIGL